MRRLVSLCRLSGEKAGDALQAGTIGASHGWLIARVPSAALRDELMDEVTHHRFGGGVMPREELDKRIKLEYMVELRGVEF